MHQSMESLITVQSGRPLKIDLLFHVFKFLFCYAVLTHFYCVEFYTAKLYNKPKFVT